MSTPTATAITAATFHHPPPPIPKTPPTRRALRRPSNTASTPNLKSAYASHSRRASRAPLSRRISLATLTQSSLLPSIPNDKHDTDIYHDENLIDRPASRFTMAPATPGKTMPEDVDVGDAVDVPGNMQGIVRFVGPVQGKKGIFAGVELDAQYAARGKNNGDVDGISYFATSIPGAGIFLPVAKAMKLDSGMSFPMTPSSGLKSGSQNSTNYTPPTPGLPKFSMSVGPGARAPSPQGKRSAPRTSLPRPDSPVRRTQMNPGPRPSIAGPAKTPSRYGSPTNRFAQSVRGTAGDPSKRLPAVDRKPSMPLRSASALGSFDDDLSGMGLPRSKTNGNIGAATPYGKGPRSPTRAPSRANVRNDEEIERLKAQLEDKEKQLKEQSATLNEMESSLTELQGLMENAGDLRDASSEFADKDTSQLRNLLREKNEKIAMLTSEFDAHRADFRSTIDALEMASTETERVYEKRMEELMADIRELESRNVDVESVATQLRQLEELVLELEEGLEDARRGEAEARGEVEFLRGEVERTRTELRREREKGGQVQSPTMEKGSMKELEAKDDEIRGLKAIIHSLSRDSASEPRSPPQRPGSLIAGDVIEQKIARDNLERQVAELQSILTQKSSREQELEQELEKLRVDSSNSNNDNNTHQQQRSSLRDSRDTVVLAAANENRFSGRANNVGESDNQSNATENSTLWCEICETSGHDILTCTNMFGPDGGKPTATDDDRKQSTPKLANNNALRPPGGDDDDARPAPLSSVRSRSPAPPAASRPMPDPMESGPVAGKESGIMDPEKWCAMCERDGHDSVDCPFEDAF
ncbi:uncharacterized protein F5Z01DRAFT_442518 [Emericellopsis atlantica]|uniref:CAP-Gly domain-containing protein n=1 Tax=Emericellopsis atlantica TaxID=2614577 RepID=A0A9P7ZRG6_9HYPO|nr:uncharacterized protein F5Z01DRAFT_442518 [Emericellopsis atlantica]KAG9256959.1 hypothetical protein F5Z01DRAFT_442518 [Emericellopsis atlantica]